MRPAIRFLHIRQEQSYHFLADDLAWAKQVGATYYGGLPDKLAPTRDMVAVDTLSLPGASIIIYNNWPRVPTGTPAFIIRYCQIEACAPTQALNPP